MPTSQIRSRERIANLGEVFTAQREIELMVDLWLKAAQAQGTAIATATVLEPSCGNCGFLIELLKRKVGVLKAESECGSLPSPRDCILALSSLYGIDISEVNITDAFQALSEQWLIEIDSFGKEVHEKLKLTGLRILKTNLIHTNFLQPGEIPLIERVCPDQNNRKNDKVIEKVWSLNDVLNPGAFRFYTKEPHEVKMVDWHQAGYGDYFE